MSMSFRALLVGAIVALSLALPASVAGGGGPAPGEQCVPGTIWEDTSSGVKYICIYDELYGGTRWERLSGGSTGNEAWVFRSSTLGCARLTTSLTGVGGSGADAIVRSYRWPCATVSDRSYQPVGELRTRIVIQRYNGSWGTCRDSGYLYSTTTAAGWVAGLDMGAAADCGSGTYRAWGFGAIFQGGGWRGGAIYTPSMFLR